jgi:ribonuclease P protein component
LETLDPEKPVTRRLNQKNFCFGSPQRLLSANDYKNVFDHSHFRASHKNALMLAHLNKKSGARLGLVFGKKNVARAVDRNRLKRVSREQFRLHNKELTGLDIIIMARGGLAELTNDVYAKLILGLMESITQQRLRKKEK